jgi:wyosine [tRNA(Phe)-imidazoG37] synthetase (radical SAM superfamily)
MDMSSNKTRDDIEDEFEELDTITLEFDDGVVIETEALGVFEVDGKEYIALIPEDGSDDVYIYGYKEVEDSEDEFEIIDIEEEAEFKKAVEEFEKLMGGETGSETE